MGLKSKFSTRPFPSFQQGSRYHGNLRYPLPQGHVYPQEIAGHSTADTLVMEETGF